MKRGKTLAKRVWVEKIPKRALFVDTETIEHKDGRLELLLGCYEIWSVTKKGKRIGMLSHGVFYTIEAFHQIMRDSVSVANTRVIAHNWNFDASVLRIASKVNRESFGYSIDFAKSIMPNESSAYSPFLLTLDYGDNYAELLDNTNYYTLPLAMLGDSLGIAKLDMPQTSELESMIAYCYRDVEILREAYFRIFEFVAEIANTTPSITTASAAMRVFRTAFYEQNGQVQGSQHIESVNKAERQAYHGGRTDTFWKGKPITNNPIYKYDVNSLYPSCMLGDIPIRYIQRVSGDFDIEAYSSLYGNQNRIGLYDVTLDIPESGKYASIGLEGLRTKDGLLFPIGKFRVWLWQPLYAIAKAQGYIADTHRIYLYESEPLFKGYIERLYELRQGYKRKGNYAYDLLTKLMMNSLYGKFGQRAYGKWVYIEDENELSAMLWPNNEGITRFDGYYEDLQHSRSYLQVDNDLWKYDDSQIGELSLSSVCSIAGYITAMGRAIVWKAMASVIDARGQIYMCDTDSVVCDVRLPSSMVSKTELGLWKLEGVSQAQDCDFFAPKHYIYKGMIKLKGVRNPSIGQTIHKQTRFPRFMTDLASENPTRQENLELGGSIFYIESEPSGINKKRIEQGLGLPTLPFVI